MSFELPEREPCPFCENFKIKTDTTDIRRVAFVERQELTAAFVNRFQVRRGAVLVVTTRHAPTLLDLTESEAEALGRMVRRVAHGIYGAFRPIGLNVFQDNGVVGGQSVPHYHVHIVPRYPGDSPDQVFWREDVVLIEYEERVRRAEQIAEHLPE